MHTATYYPSGNHILLDFWGATGLQDIVFIESALRQAAAVCSATVLDIKLHQFGENEGVTGVALLAESHISIHTWPETGYAALDVFVCGKCDAEKALLLLRDTFNPQRFKVSRYLRGTE